MWGCLALLGPGSHSAGSGLDGSARETPARCVCVGGDAAFAFRWHLCLDPPTPANWPVRAHLRLTYPCVGSWVRGRVASLLVCL